MSYRKDSLSSYGDSTSRHHSSKRGHSRSSDDDSDNEQNSKRVKERGEQKELSSKYSRDSDQYSSKNRNEKSCMKDSSSKSSRDFDQYSKSTDERLKESSKYSKDDKQYSKSKEDSRESNYTDSSKKISFGLSQKSAAATPKIAFGSFKMGGPKSSDKLQPTQSFGIPKPVAELPAKSKMAQAFGDDSEDEEEEMPPEAKMRMKNIGRETPTSAGPNSFGKARMGFCDSKKIFERQLNEAAED